MEIKPSEKILGIVYAYTNENHYDMVKALGTSYIRINVPFPWEDKLYGKVSKAWENTKKAFKVAVDAGLKVMPSTPGMGGWGYDAATNTSCWTDAWPAFVGVPGSDVYYENVKATTEWMCRDLGGLADGLWQCMNELDIPTFRGDYPIEVAVDTCRASAEGIMRANPNALCGTNFAGWYEEVKPIGDLLYRPGHQFRYVGDDQYYGSWQPHTVEKWQETLDEMWDRWKLPILVNEWGYSSAGETLAQPPKPEEITPGWTDVCMNRAWYHECEGGHTEEAQAAYFRRGLEIFAKHPHVLGTFLFCFSDAKTCWHCGQHACPAECFWGITDVNCNPKPAYFAVQEAIKEYFK